MKFFKFIYHSIRLYYASRMALNAHHKTGERYFVLPDQDDRLIILSRRDFRRFKLNGQITHDATTRDLIKECFFLTPARGETHPVHPSVVKAKKMMYLEYVGL